ncbi:MAG: DUF4344 domain-containing metallopeptidase [Bacteroidota bacterium]
MTASRFLAGLTLVALLAAPLAAQSFGAGARAIQDGDALTGALTGSDPTLDDGSHYDLYRYDGRPGETVVFTLRSDDFDAYLSGGPIADSFELTDSDDDGAGGTDAQITVTLSGTGSFALLANSLGGGATGRYTLTAESLGGGAVASDVREIRDGETLRGRLDTNDTTLDDGSYYDLYLFRGAPGDEITVTMRSTDFDTFLSGGPIDGTTLDVQETDDDGAGGTDSQLIVTVGANGLYGIRANSLEGGRTGAYSLSVEAFGSEPVVDAEAVRAGESVSGQLAAGSPTLSDGSYYALYTFQGQPGEEIEVFLASADFDAFLLGGPTPADAFAGTHTDDDGGGGTNSELRVAAGSDGRYTIVANTYAAGATGAFQVTVRSLDGGDDALPGITRIGLAQTVTGQLASTDATLDDGSYYDLYVYNGAPGQDIVITLSSDRFDPYLILSRLVGGEFESVADDDDSGPGVNARVRARIGPTGTYVILANSYAQGATGLYTLSVETPDQVADEAEAESSAPTLTTGTPASGRLEAGDTVLADDSFADLYLYRGTPGETVAVTLRSRDFNAYLSVGTLEGEDVEIVGRDDDGAGGTDARVQFTVGAGGLHAIQANSLRGGETGAYTVTVERVQAQAQAPGRTTTTQSPVGEVGSRFSGKWTLGGYGPNPQFADQLGAVRQFVSEGGFLERTAESLNSSFPLPRNLPISFAECSDPGNDRPWPYINAFYSPSQQAVTFCYELIADLVRHFSETRPEGEVIPAVMGAYDFVMLHEAGHALRHQLDLPFTGMEEDVVDQFATLMLLQEGDKGVEAALAGVDYLSFDSTADMDLTDAQRAELNRRRYAGEHSLGPQRLFNVQCWVFGSNPDKYIDMVVDETGNELTDENALTVQRARRCPGEYEQMVKSFSRLLELAYRE